jgi:hypothetical protein
MRLFTPHNCSASGFCQIFVYGPAHADVYRSSIYAEFIVSVYSMDMAPDRRRDVHDFLLQRVGFARAVVIESLWKCEIGSEMFAFDLDHSAPVSGPETRDTRIIRRRPYID